MHAQDPAMTSPSPYTTALAAIDAAHASDPTKITIDGTQVPYELHYAQKCTAYLSKRCPSPSEALRLAIRAQHFRRWEVPRSSYPMTRAGYHAWRTYLKKRQADLVLAILDEAGYSSGEYRAEGQRDGAGAMERVARLIRKEGLQDDEETQILEDVACLVFLDDQFEQFEKEHDQEKILRILRKTWGKMTDEGHQLALQIPMSGRPQELIQKALAG